MLLDVKALKVNYRTIYGDLEAVRSLDFSVERGESIAIVGESGCGKSTLGLAIVRLLPPNASSGGNIVLDGKDLLKLSNFEIRMVRGTDVFMIFQDPLNSLNPVKRVSTQLLEALAIRQKRMGRTFDEKATYNDIVEGLTNVRMPDPEVIMERYPHQLSGGQIQRVVIAMALLMKPKLLIADEPTSALDVTIQAQVIKLINDLKKEYGMAVLFITHDMAVAFTVANKFLVMYAGELSEAGPVNKVVKSPLHPYTEALVNSVPSKSRNQGDLSAIPGSPPNMLSPPRGCRFHPRCPRVMDVCRVESPGYAENDERTLRCHLYD
jgi:peptide/nickel transport system ATP-binding protein